MFQFRPLSIPDLFRATARIGDWPTSHDTYPSSWPFWCNNPICFYSRKLVWNLDFFNTVHKDIDDNCRLRQQPSRTRGAFLSSRCTKLCDQTLVRLRPEITFTNPEKREKERGDEVIFQDNCSDMNTVCFRHFVPFCGISYLTRLIVVVYYE